MNEQINPVPAPPATLIDSLFDEFWDRTVPLPFRYNKKLKGQARVTWNKLVLELQRGSGTPNAVRCLAALLKIGRVLTAAKVIVNDPNPDPETIATAVEALIERLKLTPEENQL